MWKLIGGVFCIKSLGTLTVVFPNVTISPMSANERDRQLSLQVQADIPAALGMSVGIFEDAFPQAESQPREYQGLYDYALYVTNIGKLSLDTQMSLIGGVNYISDRVTQWDQKPPLAPYVAWTNGGISNRNKSVDIVRRSLPRNARGAVISEGILQALVHPDTVKGYALDLPGSSVGAVRAANLSWFSDRPKLIDYWTDNANPVFGSLVAGSK